MRDLKRSYTRLIKGSFTMFTPPSCRSCLSVEGKWENILKTPHKHMMLGLLCNIYITSVFKMFLFFSRDEAQSKMLALKEKADKELSQYQMEIKELVRVIDHDRNLKAFMSRKDHERTEAHEHMEEMKKKRGKEGRGGRGFTTQIHFSEAEKTSERERTVMVRLYTSLHRALQSHMCKRAFHIIVL